MQTKELLATGDNNQPTIVKADVAKCSARLDWVRKTCAYEKIQQRNNNISSDTFISTNICTQKSMLLNILEGLDARTKATGNRKIKISYKNQWSCVGFLLGVIKGQQLNKCQTSADIRLQIQNGSIRNRAHGHFQHCKCKRKDGIPQKLQNQMHNQR